MNRAPAFVSFLVALISLALFASAASASASEAPASASPPAPSLPLDSLRGQVVLVDFWASWCAPCKKSFPWMSAILDRHAAEGLVILAVNLDKKRKDADAFLAKQDGKPRILYDPEGRLAASYELKAMPTSFLYDRKGILRETHLGFTEKDAAAIEAAIVSLLAERVGEPKENRDEPPAGR